MHLRISEVFLLSLSLIINIIQIMKSVATSCRDALYARLWQRSCPYALMGFTMPVETSALPRLIEAPVDLVVPAVPEDSKQLKIITLMKTKLLLWLAVASISTATWASEPEALNVHRSDATIRSTMLDNIQTIRFSDDETEMLIWTVDQQALTQSIPDILKVTFGDYLANNEVTDVPDTRDLILDTRDVRKVLENGQVVIIKNGVRYNVLGVQL